MSRWRSTRRPSCCRTPAAGPSAPWRSARCAGPRRCRTCRPSLPTIAETLPGFDAAPSNHLAAPAGTPAAAVARLNAVVNAILADPEFRRRMAEMGEEPVGGTPEELAAAIREESARWQAVIAAAGIRAE
jgi:tripartite-type tricarboxylate transporter receptor subunit TctC